MYWNICDVVCHEMRCSPWPFFSQTANTICKKTLRTSSFSCLLPFPNPVAGKKKLHTAEKKITFPRRFVFVQLGPVVAPIQNNKVWRESFRLLIKALLMEISWVKKGVFFLKALVNNIYHHISIRLDIDMYIYIGNISFYIKIFATTWNRNISV